VFWGCEASENGGDCLVTEVDLKKFVVSRREIVVFKCELSEASTIVAAVLADSGYRSLRIGFAGYSETDLPLVEIEVEFAVR